MVLKLGIEPGYVLDQMEFYEISSLLKHQYYKDKESWEQTRFLGFLNARCSGAKIGKMEDLIEFQWEKEEKEQPRFLSDEEISGFRDKAKWIIENNMLGE